jgi:hypothetical protein
MVALMVDCACEGSKPTGTALPLTGQQQPRSDTAYR